MQFLHNYSISIKYLFDNFTINVIIILMNEKNFLIISIYSILFFNFVNDSIMISIIKCTNVILNSIFMKKLIITNINSLKSLYSMIFM